MTPTKSPTRSRRRSGQSIVEFSFVGIPLIFILISIFEMSRGMWIYHTLAYSVKQGVRYASVHGYNCGSPSTNTCQVAEGPPSMAAGDCTSQASHGNWTNGKLVSIATVIWCTGVGLDPAVTTLTFTDGAGVVTSCTMNSCPATNWPPLNSNLVGETISIQITTPFKSMIALFWPGSKPVAFGVATLPASSTDTIKF